MSDERFLGLCKRIDKHFDGLAATTARTIIAWNPQPDITVYELALSLNVREQLKTSRTPEQLFEDLPECVRKHFKKTTLFLRQCS